MRTFIRDPIEKTVNIFGNFVSSYIVIYFASVSNVKVRPLLFTWVMFMIGFFICSNKGLLFLFQDCLNVEIV